jgi:hypothetical protein
MQDKKLNPDSHWKMREKVNDIFFDEVGLNIIQPLQKNIEVKYFSAHFHQKY